MEFPIDVQFARMGSGGLTAILEEGTMVSVNADGGNSCSIECNINFYGLKCRRIINIVPSIIQCRERLYLRYLQRANHLSKPLAVQSILNI